MYALRNYGILCIGLHRFRDTKLNPLSPSSKRYVITNPPDDFPLLTTDMVGLHFNMTYANSNIGSHLLLSGRERESITEGVSEVVCVTITALKLYFASILVSMVKLCIARHQM